MKEQQPAGATTAMTIAAIVSVLLLLLAVHFGSKWWRDRCGGQQAHQEELHEYRDAA
ncbi:MAG: hypothetical protein AB7G38_12920 [Dehalococcoidia bacterium]